MRFTIRDVLWLTVVSALSVGWWVEHRRAVATENAWKTCFQSALEKLAFHVQGNEAMAFDTPSGQWQIHCTVGVLPPDEE